MTTALILLSFIPSYWREVMEPPSPVLFPSTSMPNHPRNTHVLTNLPRGDYVTQEFIPVSLNTEVRNFIQAFKLHSSN